MQVLGACWPILAELGGQISGFRSNCLTTLGRVPSPLGSPEVTFRGVWRATFPRRSGHLILSAITSPHKAADIATLTSMLLGHPFTEISALDVRVQGPPHAVAESPQAVTGPSQAIIEVPQAITTSLRGITGKP